MEGLCESSLAFFSDQRQCRADVLPPAEARARIEVAVLGFLRTLTSRDPAISHLPLVVSGVLSSHSIAFLSSAERARVERDSHVRFEINRTSSNSGVNHGLLTRCFMIFLSHSCCTRSLMRANATKAFIRVWKVMEMCYQILLQEKRVTQRELYYKLLCTSSEYFTSQLQVNKGNPSRYSLGIMASSRGLVAGRLLLQVPALKTFQNPLHLFCDSVISHIACNVKWLGLRGSDLDLIPEESFIPLKPKDIGIAKSLMSSKLLQEKYQGELALMTETGQRAEIEALYFHGYDYLGKYIAKKIVQVDYI
ncbi:hypothetical protein NL676_010148 [Syzygium grande]|nr:hypothetical protein NL676_010148 [Syzygium grande]